MEERLGKSCWQLTGQGEAEFTAGHLRVQGGGRPFGRAIKAPGISGNLSLAFLVALACNRKLTIIFNISNLDAIDAS